MAHVIQSLYLLITDSRIKRHYAGDSHLKHRLMMDVILGLSSLLNQLERGGRLPVSVTINTANRTDKVISRPRKVHIRHAMDV